MEKALFYKDIILKHRMSVVKSRVECDISSEIAGKKIQCPVFCSNMPSVLTYDIAKQFDKAGWFHVWHRMGNTETYVQDATDDGFNFISISVGVKQEDVELLKRIKSYGYRIDVITIDVALVHNIHFKEYLQWIREEFPNTYLIAGNCDSFRAVEWLENLGIDCAKIFVGVSTACRTREFSGFGSSTVTDLIDIKDSFDKRASQSFKPKKIKIVSDGGMTVGEDGQVWIGDAAKSIRFGADFIMSGKIFSNCIDSPALINGYSGNSTARIKGHSRNVEGTTVNVQSNGLTIKQMMNLIEDSLRSSVSYAGGKDLSALKTVDYQIV